MKARSPVLYLAVRYLMPLLLIFSFFLLLRGHNEVGGGFVGGLVASSAFMLYSIARSPAAARGMLPFSPLVSMVTGLALAFTSGLLSFLYGKPFMTGIWMKEPIPVLGKLGTPFVFDLGVYLLVVGVCLHILLTLAEE